MLRFESDPYARTLSTRAVSVTPHEGSWHVTLEDTIFYPTGGGQPHDTGSIAGAPVLDVFRHDGHIVHVVSEELTPGPVELRLHWGRRYDHMQQHTAQHLLTAILADRYGAPTTSWHLGETYTAIELEADDLPALAELEAVANAAILEDIAVRSSHVTRDVYEGMEVRSRGLPEGVMGPIRIVEIDGIDKSACGGTHVSRLGQVRAVKLLRTQRARGRLLLSFLAGERVVARLGASLGRERRLSELLSSGPEDHVALVEGLQRSLKEAERAERRLRAELLDLRAQALVAGEPARIVWHEAGADMGALHALAGHLERLQPGVLMILTAGPDQGAGVFLVAGPADEVAQVGPQVAQVLEGRGGGRPGRYQGKGAKIERRRDLEDLA